MAGLLVPFQRRTGVEAATQDATGLGSLSLQRPLVASVAYLLLPSASPVGRVRLTITNISGQFPGFQFYIPTPRDYLDCTAPGGDADGGTHAASYNYPPPGQRTWRPVFAVPAVPNSITMGHTSPSSPGAMYRVEHAELLDVPAPPGAPHSWQMLDVETDTGTPPLLWAIGAANGPWTTSEAVGKALSVYATLDSPGTVTVPLLSSGGPIVARMTSKSGPPPVLVALGGATDNGDGTVTAPAGVRCFPAWDASVDVTLVATKLNTGAYTVLYGPFYLDTPPIPPPAPTITKLIPTSGPDTGGTLVDVIGTDLTGATAVDFGGTAGTGLTVDPFGGLATVTSPAHTAGPAPVTITTPAGVSNAETFTFEAPPVVTVPVIAGTYPLYLCADAPDNQQVLSPIIFPVTDVVSAEVGGVDVGGVVGVLDVGGGGFVAMGAPVLPPGTYDLILTNSAGSSDPFPVEYVDCEGCPPDPTVVAVFPGAALPGATIQLVGTNLTDATVTMCGETAAIASNTGNIITMAIPPTCPDGPTTITVTTPNGETTADLTVLPVPEPGECPSLADWCGPDTPCPDCVPCVVVPPRPLIAMWADLAAQIRCGWPDDRCPPGAVTVEATQQPLGSDCDAEVQVIPGGPAGADRAGVTTWGGRIVVLRPWAQINEAGQLTDAAQAQRLEAIARSLEDLQIMQQLIVAAACGACGPGGATIERVERVTSTTTLGWAFAVRIS